MKGVPLRLLPGDDLRLALEAWMGAQQIAPRRSRRQGRRDRRAPLRWVAGAHHRQLVVGLLPDWRLHRELDPATGYTELWIKPPAPG